MIIPNLTRSPPNLFLSVPESARYRAVSGTALSSPKRRRLVPQECM